LSRNDAPAGRKPADRGPCMKEQIHYWYIVAQELDLFYWGVLVLVGVAVALLLAGDPLLRKYKKWKWKNKMKRRRT